MSYTLKVILDLSVDINHEKETVLTSKILSYNPPPPKRKIMLQDLPIFSPDVPYRNLANRILNMFYYERIEVFFNPTTFKKVIMNSWNGIKEENATERLKIEQQNFDIFIKAILPTAYPISNNYNKSLDYFDRESYSFFTKGTTKGLNTSYFPFLPSRFGKEFSHIKVNGEIYTITGVTLKNDIFNHPIYSKLIQEYENIATNIDTDGDNPLTIVEKEFHDFYNTQFSENSIFSSIETVSPTNNDNKGMYYNEIYEKVKEVKKAITNIKTEMEKNTNPKEANPKEANPKEANPKEANPQSFDLFFENLNTLYEYKNYIQQVTNVSNEHKIQQVISVFGKLYIKKKALEYIKNRELDLSNEGTRETEIQSLIEKYSPAFRNFSKLSTYMLTERYIQNETWRKIIHGKDNSKYPHIKKCKKNVNNCTDLYKDGILEVNLDRVKDTKTNNYTIIEAHLMINVIEGDMNITNYKKLKCYYLDKSLGSMFDSILYSKNNWDIANKKIFFSIKDEVKNINEKKKKIKNNEPKKKIKNNEPKKNTQKKKQKQNDTKKKK